MSVTLKKSEGSYTVIAKTGHDDKIHALNGKATKCGLLVVTTEWHRHGAISVTCPLCK